MILEIASFIGAQSWGLRRSTAVEIPTTGAGASHSPRHHSFLLGLLPYERSLEELLRLQVQGRALLDRAEALDLQGSTGLLDGHDPGAVLPGSTGLLAHNLAILVPGQVLRLQAARGLHLRPAEHHCLGMLALANLAHGLLLHGLHGLHCLHCLRHCWRVCFKRYAASMQ